MFGCVIAPFISPAGLPQPYFHSLVPPQIFQHSAPTRRSNSFPCWEWSSLPTRRRSPQDQLPSSPNRPELRVPRRSLQQRSPLRGDAIRRGRPRRSRLAPGDDDGLAALAHNHERARATLEVKPRHVGADRLGHPQPVHGEQRRQGVVVGRAETGLDEEGAQLVRSTRTYAIRCAVLVGGPARCPLGNLRIRADETLGNAQGASGGLARAVLPQRVDMPVIPEASHGPSQGRAVELKGRPDVYLHPSFRTRA